MSSLVDSLRAQITPDLVQRLASNLGESGVAIEKGLQGGSVAMLAAVATKAHDTAFLSQIMNLISSFAIRGSSAMSAAAGASTSSVVGSKVSRAGKISEFANLRGSTAGSILSAAAPLVLGTLATKVHSEGLGTSGLGSLLSSELPNLRSFLPAWLSIPGLSEVTSRVSRVAEDVRPSLLKWAISIVLIALPILALLWFTSRKHPSIDGALNASAFIKTSLPGGVELNIPQNGMEYTG
jgi:hypothetical protein